MCQSVLHKPIAKSYSTQGQTTTNIVLECCVHIFIIVEARFEHHDEKEDKEEDTVAI